MREALPLERAKNWEEGYVWQSERKNLAPLNPVGVLVIGFNRSAELQKVLEALAPQNVKKIYLWVDGPRPGNSTDALEQSRIMDLVEKVNLPFPVETSFQTENLGCGRSVAGAISWFFAHEELGAILEDDCIPSPGFIQFMSEQLRRWESDETVLTISGNSLVNKWPGAQYSYHFSKYPLVWGWATWRSVWEKYDFHISAWNGLKNTRWLKEAVGLKPDSQRYWRYQFNQVERGEVDTWDYQLTFLSFLERGSNIIPHANLVDNVGFGLNATHTKERPVGLVNGYGSFQELQHPPASKVDETLDRFLELEIIRTRKSPMEMVGAVRRGMKRFFAKSPLSR